MNVPALKGAPQLTILLRQLPVEVLRDVAAALAEKIETSRSRPPPTAPQAADFRALFESLHHDDLSLLEHEASRITRLATNQADALHLRLAASMDFDCRAKLEALPGSLARAGWAYVQMAALFRHVERAMQLRSYREHRTYYESYDLSVPVPVDLAQIDAIALETAITEKLNLRDGCTVEAVEMSDQDQSSREIMIAVVAGGALASQLTFASDKRVDTIQYRPATELILVYRPHLGNIEICGREWNDRRAVANLFARTILKEDLSDRPLKQRNYDLRPFKSNLIVDIPEGLLDVIVSAHVTEARFALGSYDRKITISALAGEPIAQIAKDTLRGLKTFHGRPFLCDIELLLRVSLPDREEQSLRFKITNQNRSTLQSETDNEKREVGFALLEALGVVSTVRKPTKTEVSALFPTLLDLLDHCQKTITAPELGQLNADIDRLTSLGFLHQRNIASTVLIDDDDIGPLEAHVDPSLSQKSATYVVGDVALMHDQNLDSLLSWTINRSFVRESVFERLTCFAFSSRPQDHGHGLFSLGEGLIGSERRPIYLWEGGSEPKSLERADRNLRTFNHRVPGLVLTPGPKPASFLSKHLVLEIKELIGPEARQLDSDKLLRLWNEGRATAAAADGVEFQDFDDTAVLILPGQSPWTILGRVRVDIVRQLYHAHLQGKIGIRTGVLLKQTGSSGMEAAFGPEWSTLIEDRYLFSPKYANWALKIERT